MIRPCKLDYEVADRDGCKFTQTEEERESMAGRAQEDTAYATYHVLRERPVHGHSTVLLSLADWIHRIA